MPEDSPPSAAHSFSGRTAWARNLQTPLRVFLRTETGSAAVLLGMTVAALAWVNIDAASYDAVWGARLSVTLNGAGVSLDLREWVNSGLMTFFFFVFGLEARREFDMGELRERARLALPVAAGLGGLLVPVGIYLAVNAGRNRPEPSGRPQPPRPPPHDRHGPIRHKCSPWKASQKDRPGRERESAGSACTELGTSVSAGARISRLRRCPGPAA